MLKSLYSGVSGLSANQTKLDVIGNNIANVGTTAFKGSRVRFEDELSQTIKDATVPTTDQGGANEAQVGLGVKLAGIDTLTNQGAIQSTGRNLDAAIDGEGYFVVSNGPTVFTDNSINVNQSTGQHTVDENSLSKIGTSLMYTRDGSFTLDKQGNLLSSDGLRIMGYSLTNDNSTTLPTASEPNPVLAGGFSFQFGAGEALNGYTVVLGTIGEGTLTSASVDTTNKKIILNGDFSDAGKISTSAAEKAINDALSTSGIAQTVTVGGAANPVYGTTSDLVSDGINAVAADSVSAGGFNFAFNAGSQLNGYTIKFGTIAAGTAASANINTTSKVITLNADLTTLGAVKASDIQTVLQNALQTAQATTSSLSGASITVSGSPINIGASDKISSGTVTYRGMNFSFTDSAGIDQLNGYKIQLGTVVAGTATSATLDTANKVITVNGDINSMTAYNYQSAIQDAITKAHLSGATTSVSANLGQTKTFGGFNIQITDSSANPTYSSYTIQLASTLPTSTTAPTASISNGIITITGDASSLDNLTASQVQSLIKSVSGMPTTATVTVTGNQIPVINQITSTTTAVALNSSGNGDFGGFSIDLPDAYSGYTIKVGTTTTGTANGAVVDTTNKTITINGGTIKTLNETGIQNLLNTAALASTGVGASVSGSGSITSTTDAVTLGSDGTGTFGGFSIDLPSAYSGYKIQVGTTTAGTTNGAIVDATNKTITINGASLSSLTATQLQTLLNSNSATTLSTMGASVKYTSILPNVSGTPTSLSSIASNLIDGGVDSKNPGTVNSSGFNFTFGPGEELNGYKIKIGTISKGTQLSTDIDTTNKTITINGDFVTANAVGSDQLTAVLNNALSKKGITQSVTATGSALTIPGTTSSQVSGGTPLESIGSDGVIDFVDGSKDLYSYDSSLKTLRIPDSVHDDATNTDYKVKSFSIGTTGIITATLENGKVAALGQIAMANFSNAAGLTKAGNNTYTSSITSGVAVFKSGVGTKGEDNSALYGDVKSSSLEASNVDLAQQFTDMIVASRAFQANGKTISTGDEILQDIINLKR